MKLRLFITICIIGMTHLLVLSQTSDSWAGGDGTKDNPFQISDIGHLRKLAYDCNRGISFKGKYFIMTNDIVDNHDVLDNDGELSKGYYEAPLWTPIGASKETPFMGHFDGNNHEIRGILGCHDLRDNDMDNWEMLSLFDYTEKASISNLKVKDSYYGSMIFSCKSTTIDNCVNYATCQVGIVNYADHQSLISNCGNYGLAYFAGLSSLWVNSFPTFRNCYNFGRIQIWTPNLIGSGGLIARDGILENCFNMGTVISMESDSRFSWAGGIIGTLDPPYENPIIMSNVVNYGMVEPFSCEETGAIGAYLGTSGERVRVENTYALETSSARLFGKLSHVSFRGDNLKMTEDEMKSDDFLKKLNDNAKKLKNGCCGWKIRKQGFPILEIIQEEEGDPNELILPSSDNFDSTEPRYYNLQGIKVEVPTHGIFIKVNGKKSEKVLFQ